MQETSTHDHVPDKTALNLVQKDVTGGAEFICTFRRACFAMNLEAHAGVKGTLRRRCSRGGGEKAEQKEEEEEEEETAQATCMYLLSISRPGRFRTLQQNDAQARLQAQRSAALHGVEKLKNLSNFFSDTTVKFRKSGFGRTPVRTEASGGREDPNPKP